jgi:GGDEF domain-containing protein
MDEFNRRSSTFLKARTREMQGMLGMMSDTIAFLASSSTVGVERLQSIEKNLETAADIDDVRLSRLKLSECLTSLRNESFRLRDDSRKRIQILQEGLDRAASELNAASGTSAQGNAPVNGAVRRVLDPATGLQTRSAAEMAIAAKIVDGKDELVALFLVDRLPALNSRFGRKVGDEILLLVAQHLGQHLPETSPPFRWSGPAFVALANKGDAAPTTERQIKHVASMRLEKNIDTAGRTVMLPISCSVVLQKIVASDSAEAVFQALDKFVASHGGRRDV